MLRSSLFTALVFSAIFFLCGCDEAAPEKRSVKRASVPQPEVSDVGEETVERNQEDEREGVSFPARTAEAFKLETSHE